MSNPLKNAKQPLKPRRTVLADGPQPVDVHVGNRLRMRRTLLGISQGKLGHAVNLTFQQIQKYERGANRIGASRLFEFSRILDVGVEYFFDEMQEQRKTAHKPEMSDGEQAQIDDDPMTKRETLELVRAYYKISDPAVRKRLYELVRTISEAGE